MIKVYCDICGKELKSDCSDQVNLDFNAYRTSGFESKELNLCVNCAKKVESCTEKLKSGFGKDS